MVAQVTLNKISNILKDEGCKEIFLFGSHVTGRASADSDIDIGVKGLNPSRFFAVYAKLDLVDFDEQESFFNFLNGIGELKKIG